MKIPLMSGSLPDVLAHIVEHKRRELGQAGIARDELERRAESLARRDFRSALVRSHPAVIAEIKKASPSKGLIAPDFDPARIAREYERGGAAALSVLTDGKFFQGALADLCSARSAATLPALRKDFTLDPYHVAEAAAHGADAILLIAAVLAPGSLEKLRVYAARFGMAAIVEVHDEEELRAALDSGADIVGVNNRNLRTFEVSLETSLRMAARIPPNVVKVAESGIHSAADVHRLRDAGYEAFLVGEHLMTAADPAAALGALLA